ncbi:MAG: hypothetical protein LAP40_13105 [Acidobacteriia bacterium]|nr:hypothetical protein [Terriglobia bacterium]
MNRPIDWKAVAAARGLDIPAAELDFVVQRQQALDEAFRPLVETLTPGQEPASVFRPDPEVE